MTIKRKIDELYSECEDSSDSLFSEYDLERFTNVIDYGYSSSSFGDDELDSLSIESFNDETIDIDFEYDDDTWCYQHTDVYHIDGYTIYKTVNSFDDGFIIERICDPFNMPFDVLTNPEALMGLLALDGTFYQEYNLLVIGIFPIAA